MASPTPDPSARSRAGLPLRLLLVLALLAMTGPLASDLYLSGFPVMATDLGVSASQVQLTLTAFLLGMGAGQLVFGPVSDKYGRMRPLFVGSSVFALASVLVAMAPSWEVLVIARLLQGLSAGAGVVIGRAIIPDRVAGAGAARVFTIMMTITGIAPAVAPLLGSGLLGLIDWRGILWVLAGAALLMLTCVLLVVRESLPPVRRRPGRTFGGLGVALRNRRFVGYIVMFGATFGILMGYISASPFLYQSVIGLSPVHYGLAFGANALGMMISGTIAARLVGRVPIRRTVSVAGCTALGLAVLFLVLVLVGVPAGWLAVPVFLLVSSIGFLMGNTTALALAEVRHVAGSGSAWLGGAQFAMGALVSPLVGLAGEHSALPLGIALSGSALLMVCALAYTADRFHTPDAGR
ncbi:multidrug effflux MFS transporter [Specibacter cremeus]|uniref:multidrug effflux MFS transporter n=1 Tax=Specibacter cremeus TaxID=1629051 RepID=UPI001F0CC01F|nr:multidrug effflux MFS transporter [Specibacter cremeus]